MKYLDIPTIKADLEHVILSLREEGFLFIFNHIITSNLPDSIDIIPRDKNKFIEIINLDINKIKDYFEYYGYYCCFSYSNKIYSGGNIIDTTNYDSYNCVKIYLPHKNG